MNFPIFDHLPNERKLQIADTFGVRDLSALAPTTRTMYQLLNDPLYRLAISQHPTGQLFKPIRDCNLLAVETFLEAGVLVSKRGIGNCTALHIATLGGTEEISRLEISKEADTDAFDHIRGIPLH